MEVNGDLSRIGRRTGTDKATFHGFANVYERFFHDRRLNPLKLFEVGIQTGASLKMWEEYFPYASIYGVDLTLSEISHKFSERTQVGVADQMSVPMMTAVFKKFGLEYKSLDICIDDGGHRMSQQNRTIGICWPYLKPGGTYVLEDVHTAFPELVGLHAHIPYQVGYLDESPTSAERIRGTMLGMSEQFPGVPVNEIQYVSFISNVSTRSFTCIIQKAL